MKEKGQYLQKFSNKETPSSAFEIQDGYLLEKNLAYDKKRSPEKNKRTFRELIKE